MHNYYTPHIIKENFENFLIHRCNYILLSQVYCVWQVVKTSTIILSNPVFWSAWCWGKQYHIFFWLLLIYKFFFLYLLMSLFTRICLFTRYPACQLRTEGGGLGVEHPPPEIPKISVESSIAWARRTSVSISFCSSLYSHTVVIY